MKLVGMCKGCGEWTYFMHDPERFLQSDNRKCDHCHLLLMDPRSVISERSFNAIAAKKKTADWRRKHGIITGTYL